MDDFREHHNDKNAISEPGLQLLVEYRSTLDSQTPKATSSPESGASNLPALSITGANKEHSSSNPKEHRLDKAESSEPQKSPADRLSAVKKNGALIHKDNQGNPDEIYAINKSGRLEHWVRVKQESGRQHWVVDYENRTKEQVIKASKLAESNEKTNEGGTRSGMSAHTKDIPIAMQVSVDAAGGLVFQQPFSSDGKNMATITHRISLDGKRLTSTT